jgi:N-methylhydantoinase B
VSTSDRLGREAQASPAGGPDLFNVSGLNQYGEQAGAVFLDQTMTGGGAYAHRDGLTAQGQRCITAGRTPNIESLEVGIPLLYLHRRLVADTAGPGRNRGGQSAGAAYILHDAQRLHVLVACHGYQSPNSVGLFGGYPSGCNRRLFLRNSNVRELVAAGRMPRHLAEITGDEVVLEAKAPMFEFGPDDVYEWWPQAGGGWGDPLERAIESIAEDLRTGVISEESATAIYGIALDPTGRVDSPASDVRRTTIRAERRAWSAERHMKSKPELTNAESIAPMGEGAQLVRGRSGVFVLCRCGNVLAPANENWKSYAGHAEVQAAALGANVTLHEFLHAHLYACGACGKLLGVEVRRDGDEPLHDIQLSCGSAPGRRPAGPEAGTGL